MKKLFVAILYLVLFGIASAVNISEIELNPEGSDTGGSEWVEIYLEENAELGNYTLINNGGNRINLNLNSSGYFVYEFEKRWLNNKAEKIFLHKNNQTIDESNIFIDSENNNKTWQKCGEWVFKNSTKGKENLCSLEDEYNEENKQEVIKKSKRSLKGNESVAKNFIEENLSVTQEIKKPEEMQNTESIINLNFQSHKSEEIIYESKSEKIKKYSMYCFSGFLILIIIFLIKNDKSKNNCNNNC